MICIKTKWFRLFIGRANWLQGEPFGVRLMWKPYCVCTRPGHKYAEIGSAYDAWLTRHGFVVNQRNYRQVRNG